MADLNAEQFLSESPHAAATVDETTIVPNSVILKKVDNKDYFVQYLYEMWND
jgi:hypothetical protein